MAAEVSNNILSFAGHWTWHDLVVEDWSSEDFRQLQEACPLIEEWLEIIPNIEQNYMSVRFPNGVDAVMFGTLPYSVKAEVEDSGYVDRVHFYVQGDKLITINLDQNTREIMATEERTAMLHQCRSAVDGMFVLARTILHYFHLGLDHFEANLRKLEHAMEMDNQRYLMDKILNSRFALLYWSNLFTPFQELVAAAREGYLDKLENSRSFMQLLHRIERMDRAFRHYEDEIDTLISIDDAISAFRGNEIMKTLTILTAIFTPATVAGAIWGMNFENLPGIKVPWGFIGIMLITFLSTAIMYLWMHRKGWTGDLLKVKSKNSKI
ncbi:Mg2+ and Co2+ transporter CorA [Paenibacillus rhizosphaerae]|uniref:Mg2+ and Co2+ transporter CorA n=1 Tax=Paenibacillus rhizosphaerae TaxID=297318 RepID=A0A839U2D2_9BACL|nr:magnesium transporter CorA family protein [Paenibacillus rhizosphaerae]MBB3131920.1 Mg2+ and Co2+ transporter CorA [Paenibacillus rhizosphaerae]